VNGENEVEDGGKSSAGTRDAREREREEGRVRERGGEPSAADRMMN